MRRTAFYLLLILVVIFIANTAGAEQRPFTGFHRGENLVGKGLGIYTMVTAKGPNDTPDGGGVRMHTLARHGLVTFTASASCRDDGTAPTASVGFPVVANQVLIYTDEPTKLRALKCIEVTGGAKMVVLYGW